MGQRLYRILGVGFEILVAILTAVFLAFDAFGLAVSIGGWTIPWQIFALFSFLIFCGFVFRDKIGLHRLMQTQPSASVRFEINGDYGLWWVKNTSRIGHNFRARARLLQPQKPKFIDWSVRWRETPNSSLFIISGEEQCLNVVFRIANPNQDRSVSYFLRFETADLPTLATIHGNPVVVRFNDLPIQHDQRVIIALSVFADERLRNPFEQSYIINLCSGNRLFIGEQLATPIGDRSVSQPD